MLDPVGIEVLVIVGVDPTGVCVGKDVLVGADVGVFVEDGLGVDVRVFVTVGVGVRQGL